MYIYIQHDTFLKSASVIQFLTKKDSNSTMYSKFVVKLCIYIKENLGYYILVLVSFKNYQWLNERHFSVCFWIYTTYVLWLTHSFSKAFCETNRKCDISQTKRGVKLTFNPPIAMGVLILHMARLAKWTSESCQMTKYSCIFKIML